MDQLHLLPPAETHNTFDKYLAGFRERAGGTMDWNNYTAYEIRIIGALVRLGRRHEALELAAFMLTDQRIPPWNQWPEITWRDPAEPQLYRRPAPYLDQRGVYPVRLQHVRL